jgi:hypothetical protein
VPGKKMTDQQVRKYKAMRRTATQEIAAARMGISVRSARRIEKAEKLPSWRTPNAHRRQWTGKAILAYAIAVAKSRRHERLSLETRSMEAFHPAQNLYERFGCTYCGPFADYIEDPNRVFMTLNL